MSMLNRRRLLLGATAAPPPRCLPFRSPASRRRARPSATRSPPAWYRFKHRRVRGDRGLRRRAAARRSRRRLSRPRRRRRSRRCLRAHFLPPDAATLEQNVLVVNTGRHLVLFDTGMGESMGAQSRCSARPPARCSRNLRAAGIEPGQIDLVCATHAHCDHVWGAGGRERTSASSRTRASPSARPTCATGPTTATSAGRSS